MMRAGRAPVDFRKRGGGRGGGLGLIARSGLAAAVACALLAGPAAAQTSAELVARGKAAGADPALLEQLRERALRAGLEEAAVVRLLAPGVGLAEAGLPSGMVLQKGLEGLSKRVPPPQIAQVLSRLADAVERAGGPVDAWLARPGVREALAPPPPGRARDRVRATLVESAALALDQGAPEAAVQALLGRVPSGLQAPSVSAVGLGVALEVLAELPVVAADATLAAQLVLEALNSGFSPAELRELPGALRAAERRGQLPARAVAEGALVQLRGDIPATAVLQNLFQGNFPGKGPLELPPGLERARERARERGPPP